MTDPVSAEVAASYDGQLICQADYPDPGSWRRSGLRVLTADPMIRMTFELLDLGVIGEDGYGIRQDGNGVIRVIAENGTWLYRIDHEDHARQQWLLSWPD